MKRDLLSWALATVLVLAPGAASAQAMWSSGVASVANGPVCSLNTIGGQLAACTGVNAGILSGTTGSLGGGALLAGACASVTVAVTGSTTAMSVSATPVTYPGDGNYWMGYVSTNGTVTVKVCAAVAGTPGASPYNVRVLP